MPGLRVPAASTLPAPETTLYVPADAPEPHQFSIARHVTGRAAAGRQQVPETAGCGLGDPPSVVDAPLLVATGGGRCTRLADGPRPVMEINDAARICTIVETSPRRRSAPHPRTIAGTKALSRAHTTQAAIACANQPDVLLWPIR